MVLHCRHNDFVACLQKTAAIALRDQIDRFRGAAHKNNFLVGRRIDKSTNLFARRLIGRGGPLAEIVHTAMDVRILRAVVATERIDHLLGFLTGRAIVKIHQRLSMNFLFEYRKVLADFGHIKILMSQRTSDVRSRFHEAPIAILSRLNFTAR